MRSWWHQLIDRRRQPGVRRTVTAAVALALVALTFGGVSALAGPRQPPPPSHHPRGGHALAINGTIPRALARANRGAREDGGRALTLAISLRMQHRADLDQLVLDQQNPKSASYHRYLTPQAFTDKFGAAPDAVAAVRAFLEKAGLHVTSVSANRLQIDATGTVAQAERAFSTTISQYQFDKRTVYAPDTEPVVPDTLAEHVLGIIGLDNVAVFQPLLQRTRQAPARPAGGPAGGFDPNDLRAAYDVSPLIQSNADGRNQHIAVFELAPYIPSDLNAYRTQLGWMPPTTPIEHSVDGAAVSCSAAGQLCDVAGVAEADLDLEVISALAPSATLDVYTGPNTLPGGGGAQGGILDTYQAILTGNAAKVVTTSWGLCEGTASSGFLLTQDNYFSQMSAQGQTIFAASGDAGADDCRLNSGTATVDSPASDPYVVGVGGTSLTITTSAPEYGSEVTWNDMPTHSRAIATGGGASLFFDRPPWQVGANIPATPGKRLVPDVSANADPYTGYAIYCTSVPDCGSRGWFGGFGGTSAAAPLWAAITADINSYLLANNKALVGWINPALYQLVANSQTYLSFHDVISGNNTVDAVTGFTASQCYDQTTGLGTPDAWNIARNFASGIHTTGGGGPCPVSSTTITNLIQNGDFEAATTAPWQEFSLGGFELIGTIDPYAGSKAYLACGYPVCDDRVTQAVTVPATVNSAIFQFAVDAFTPARVIVPSQYCLDRFTATLATPDGTVFDTVVATCAANSHGYTLQAVDITAALQAHLNQSILVTLRGSATNTSGSPASTAWTIDNVALIVS